MSDLSASFANVAGGFMADGPQNASQLFVLDGWLKSTAHMPADERCVLVNWVGTGRYDAWFYEPDGAKEICEAKGYTVSLAQSLKDLEHVAGPKVRGAVENWANRKKVKFDATVTDNVKQDTALVAKTIVKSGEKVVKFTAKTVEDTAGAVTDNLGMIALAIVAVVGFIAWQKTR